MVYTQLCLFTMKAFSVLGSWQVVTTVEFQVGPVICSEDDKLVVHGMVSWGYSCA